MDQTYHLIDGVAHPCKIGTPDGPDDFCKACELCEAEFNDGMDSLDDLAANEDGPFIDDDYAALVEVDPLEPVDAWSLK